jgi:hypothetical protein
MLTNLDRYLSNTLDGFEECRDRLIRWRSFWNRSTLIATCLFQFNTYSSSLESYFTGLEIRAWGAATPSWSSSCLHYCLRVPAYLHSSRCGLIRLSRLSLVSANKMISSFVQVFHFTWVARNSSNIVSSVLKQGCLQTPTSLLLNYTKRRPCKDHWQPL